LATLTLVFALVHIATTSYSIYMQLLFSRASGGAILSWQWRSAVTARVLIGTAQMMICAVMAGAAIYLRKRGRGANLIIICARLWIAMWLIGQAVNVYLFGRPLRYLAETYSSESLTHGLMIAAVPLLILLILRRSPQPDRN
jgi:hypothetical protein